MKGSCLCGAVRFNLTGTPTAFDLLSLLVLPRGQRFSVSGRVGFKAAEFEWIRGRSLVNTFEAPVRKTPPGHRQTFCTACGAPVPTVDSEFIRVAAGSLDDDPGIRPQRHIFVDFKVPWFEITDSLGQFGTKPKTS